MSSPQQGHNLQCLDAAFIGHIVTNINDIVVILGPDGDRRYISPSVRKVLGYAPEELTGTNNYHYYHPDDMPRIREYIASAVDNLTPGVTRGEYRHRRKDGGYCWLEGEISPIPCSDGSGVQLLMVSRDISARKKAAQELQDSYDRLALAIEGAKAGVWGFEDLAGGTAYRQWWQTLGYDAGEVAATKEGWLSLCHPADRGLIDKEINDYLTNRKEKFELEYRLRHKNGTYRWVLAIGKKVTAPNGTAPHWTGLLIDVTAMKSMEAARRESERRLRDFAQAIPDVSMIIDEHGRCVEIFGQDKRLLPRPRAAMKDRTLHQGFAPREADFLLGVIRRIIQTGQPQQFGLELKDRRSFAEVRIAPMSYLAAGKRTVAAVFTDVTEKRRAEILTESMLALRRRSEFIDDIMTGKKLAAKGLAAVAALGIDLSLPLFCCLAHLAPSPGDGPNDDTLRQIKITELLGNERHWFVWDCRGDIGVLVGTEGGDGGQKESNRAAARIVKVITALAPGAKVAVGISCPHKDLEGIRKSYRQAASAVLVARSDGGPAATCHYADIGIYKFLANCGGEDQAEEYIRETLGKLLDYDRRKGTDLLLTLEEILANATLKEAARKLFLHYNTAVRHKRRIEEILGVSLEDVETRLAISVASKLLKIGREKKN